MVKSSKTILSGNHLAILEDHQRKAYLVILRIRDEIKDGFQYLKIYLNLYRIYIIDGKLI